MYNIHQTQRCKKKWTRWMPTQAVVSVWNPIDARADLHSGLTMRRHHQPARPSPMALTCGHSLCKHCVRRLPEPRRCPSCRGPLLLHVHPRPNYALIDLLRYLPPPDDDDNNTDDSGGDNDDDDETGKHNVRVPAPPPPTAAITTTATTTTTIQPLFASTTNIPPNCLTELHYLMRMSSSVRWRNSDDHRPGA